MAIGAFMTAMPDLMRQLDRFPARMIEILAILIQRLGNFYCARRSFLAATALKGLDANGDVADDDMQLRIGFRLELAVLDNVSKLFIHLFAERLILVGRIFAGVGERAGRSPSIS